MTSTRVHALLASLSGKVLDVGGSAGTLNEVLRRRVGEENVICLDNEVLHPRPNLVMGDAQQMPFKNESFDSILAGEVIEHVQSPRAFLKEAWRVLQFNGVLAISTPNKESWLNRITHSYEMPLHISLMSISELNALLKEEGFTVQKTKLFPYTPESSDGATKKWFFPVRAFVHALVPHALRENQVVVARKTPKGANA